MGANLFIFSFKEMIKKISVKIVLILILAFILDFSIGRTLRFFYFREVTGEHHRTTFAIEETNADVWVFGSSRANHHYVPSVFEDSLKMTFYNTGMDGMGIFYQTSVLKAILKRYKPRIVILDCAGGFEKGAEDYDRMAALLPSYRSHEEIRKIVDLRSRYEKYKLISEIYPFNSQILTIAGGNFESTKKKKSDTKGYIPLYNEWKSKIDSVKSYTTYETDSNSIVDVNKLLEFEEFLCDAKKSGVRVFAIYSPIFLKFHENKEIEICKGICENENVPFWDFSKDTLFLNNNLLFKDIGHLNNNGAIVFSNIVVRKIKKYLSK